MEGSSLATHELPRDHPGFADDAYRRRRAAIARVGERYTPGSPIPDVAYTPDEDQLWALVSGELSRKHERYACREYLDACAALSLPRARVPQLREVTASLEAFSGWRLEPVPGLVPTRDFYAALARRRFCSTQYLRHASVPLYTPEPDVVHELIGHANMLASPRFAALYEAAGRASLRATSSEALESFSRVFWFTIEFGVVWERSELRTYGAGLLSSYGELDEFRNAEIREWDVPAMATTSYDITTYQPVLYAAPDMATVLRELITFFDAFGERPADTLRSVTPTSRPSGVALPGDG